MNALFISNDVSIGKQGSNAYLRMREYAGAIGTLHVVVRGEKKNSIADGPLSVHVVQANRFLAPRALQKEAHALILREHIEVVSAQDPFEYGEAAMKAVKGTPAKLHIQVHTDFLSPWFTKNGNARAPKVPVSLLNFVRPRIADSVLPYADGIRVVSERVKQSLLTRYGKTIVEPVVIPIAVPATLPEKVPLPPHDFTFALITVGRLEPEKHIDDIIMAISYVALSFPAVGLFIVGDGRERKRLETHVKHLGLENRIIFLGERSDALGLMQSAQLYIQASVYEGYGRTLIEAALARIPIITTDVGIVGEVFRGYQEVYAVPPSDPKNLSAAITGMLTDHQTREVYARAAELAAHTHLARFKDQPRLIAEDLQKTLAPRA